MAAAAGSSSSRVVCVLIGLFALVLVISPTQVMAAKDLADHRQAAKTTAAATTTTTTTTTQKETAETDSESTKSGYDALCKYGCCAPVVKGSTPCFKKYNCRPGVQECTKCCSSADEARTVAASVLSNANP